jgi:hypothetical protein
MLSKASKPLKCRRCEVAEVPAARRWTLPVCKPCLPKEKAKVRSQKRRAQDREEDFKDPEHRWFGQPGKFVNKFYIVANARLTNTISARTTFVLYRWTDIYRSQLGTSSIQPLRTSASSRFRWSHTTRHPKAEDSRQINSRRAACQDSALSERKLLPATPLFEHPRILHSLSETNLQAEAKLRTG